MQPRPRRDSSATIRYADGSATEVEIEDGVPSHDICLWVFRLLDRA
jgi:hypothetical protein